MADDDINTDPEDDLGDDALDDEDLDDDALDEEDDGIGDEFAEGDSLDGDDDEDDDEDDVATPSRPARDDDDEDEDEDDVEADLDAILKDRIAAGDDDDEDEDEDAPPARRPQPAGEAEPVQARQENEFSCPNCFLLVNANAVVDGECPHCGGPI